MQEFPPPNWVYTDLQMPSDFTASIVMLIGVVIFLLRVNERRWCCFVAAFLLPVWWMYQSARGHYRGPWLNPVGAIYVPWAILTVTGLALVRDLAEFAKAAPSRVGTGDGRFNAGTVHGDRT